MRRNFLPPTLLSFCLFVICLASGAEAQTVNPPPQQAPATKGAAQPAAPKSASPTAANNNASTAAAKPTSTAAGSAKRAPAQAISVREINETALAAVLRESGTERRAPLLVNFWATWCDPCRAEFPDLVKIDREFRPRGLQFITVSLDDAAEINKGVPDFLKRMRAFDPPAYLLNANDPEAAILSIDREWRGELPATFLYDATGQLVYKHQGRIKPDELRAAIRKVMSDK